MIQHIALCRALAVASAAAGVGVAVPGAGSVAPPVVRSGPSAAGVPDLLQHNRLCTSYR